MWLCRNDILSLPHNAHFPIVSFLDIRSSPLGKEWGFGTRTQGVYIIKFEFLMCNSVSLPNKCKALTPRTPRPPIEFEISIKLITPIAKLNRETMSVLTSIGISNIIAKNTKIIICNYYIIYQYALI